MDCNLANLLHFPSAQEEEDKEKPDVTPKLRQSEQSVKPIGPVKVTVASEDSASSVSQQRASQGLFSPHGEVMKTDLLERLGADQDRPKILMERPTQSNIGIQTMDHSLCAPETVSAATQTVKNVCEQGTSTVEQNSGKQDVTVQIERGSGEKPDSAPVDDTESLHSQGEEEFEMPQPPHGHILHHYMRTIREVRTPDTRVITDVYYMWMGQKWKGK